MKKNECIFRELKIPGLQKVLRIMKLTIFILLLSVISVFAGKTYSQTKLVNLNAENSAIKEVLQNIEEQSEFVFMYSEKLIDVNRKVTVSIENKKIDEVLDDLFAGTDVSYKIKDRFILLATPEITGDDLIVQQQKTVSGTVRDETGQALPGVSVVVKGTTQGTVTDINGEYSISNVPEDAILVFSFVGMRAQEVEVGDQSTINITLRAEVFGIGEVVAIGYGVQKKINLTGAVSSVNFEDEEALTSRSVSNVSTAISGLTSGIRVQQINGLPSNNDNASLIRIRGTGSLNASSSPLVLVDGQVSDFNSVNPNDVNSISILKDAASAAIYGSRASNGVILITTKSGKDTKGKITFNYNNYVGTSKLATTDDINDNTADYMVFINMIRTNSGQSEKFSEAYINEWREGSKTDPIYYPNTNWYDAITKENITMNHHFSATGGNEKISFYSALQYFDDDGLVPNTGFKRYTFRNNLDYKVNDWLKLGNNINIIRTIAEPASIDAGWQWMRATTPGIVPKHPDGRYGAGQILAGEGGNNNQLLRVEDQRGESKNFNIQAKIYGILTPIEGLTITGSYYNSLSQTEAWHGSITADMWNFQLDKVGKDNTTGAIYSISNSYARSEREIVDLYADYVKSFGDHNLHVLAGFNQESFIRKNFSASRRNLLSYDTPVLNAAASDPQNSGSAYDYSMRSFFGRLTYNYKNKYLFESNLRYDGSSRFSPEERWGLFPSFSVAWILSEEGFWESFSQLFDVFKVRASWGQLGNNGIGNYEWQNFYQPANYALNDVAVQGLKFNSFGNYAITWETTDVLNIGADMRLFNSLNINVNYYNKFTHNILTNNPIPYVNGGISAPRVNSAEVRNSGFEAELNYTKKIGKVTLTAGANMGYNKNKIEKYKGELIEPHGQDFGAWTEGLPIGIFWIREIDHIVQDISEIDALLADGYTFKPQTPGVGDFLYKDNNGDKVIDDDDRVLKGNPIPLITYGGNLGVKYAGFDFSVYFDGVGGWDRYIYGSVYTLSHLEEYQFPKEYLNAWTPENPSTEIPKIYIGNEKNNQASDYFLRSAAYLKIRSIQLGYTLPSNLVSTVRADRVRIFTNLENYFTFTDWPLQDPEMDGAGYVMTYPLTKTISFGLNISF